MNVRILTPTQILYEGYANMVVLPGKAGELGILDKHTPLMTSLVAGSIRLYLEQAATKEFPLTQGFAQVTADLCQVYILT